MKLHLSSLRAFIPILLIAFLASCSGGGGSDLPSTDVPTSPSSGDTPLPVKVAPVISNLRYSPSATYMSASPVNFAGTFDFADSDGDLASATLTVVELPSGVTIGLQTTPIANAAGLTGGTVQGAVSALIAKAGVYSLQIFVTDVTGLRSNVLSGDVRISLFPWTQKLASPTAREFAAVAELGGRIYVLGGQRTDTGVTPGPATAVVEIYNPVLNTWTPSPPMPTARMGLVAAAVNGKLYAIGGRTDGYSTSATGAVEEFDPATQIWTTKPSMPTPRFFAAGAQYLDQEIYVAGGENGSTILSTLERYTPMANSWATLPSMPTARSQLAAVGAKLPYVVGGYAGIQSQWLGTVEVFDPMGFGTWSVRNAMPTPRAHLALAETNGKLFAAGGENASRALDTLESFDLATNTWSVKTPSPVPFTAAAATGLNGRVYVFANSRTYEYDPANDLR